MPEIVNDTLYLSYQDLVDSDISTGTIDSARQRQTKGWNFIKHEGVVFIQYAPLPEKHKDRYHKTFGNPYLASESKLLDHLLSSNQKDVDFFEAYRLQNGQFLSKDKKQQYLSAAKVLHLCSWLADRKVIGTKGIPDMQTFWQMVIALIARYKVKLPKNVKRLQEKISEYKALGAECLISDHYDNKRAAKLNDSVSQALLLEMISHNNQWDDARIAARYNEWAVKNNYKPISQTTVWNYRHKNKLTVNIGRYGTAAWHDKFNPTVHRERPSAPLLLINSDDNELDLFYQDGKKTSGTALFSLL